MPPKPPQPGGSSSRPQKRKDPPSSSSNQNGPRNRTSKRAKINDARTILAQSSDAALNTNGELDLNSFLRAREFEIRALEDSMARCKDELMTRAFQQVPRDMRRRTASHNVKRVPKRLRERGAREMREDNTPTVDSAKRKPGSSRGRVRAETAKKLGVLAAKKKSKKGEGRDGDAGVETRAARPKIRKDRLNGPPKPKSKFRKRQIHKTWLPTHMWHAKRAKMTEPKKPLWRFSIPITCTEKSYRPTHRAGGARGAVAWDMSYMSTIGLEGPMESLEKVLKLVGFDDPSLWESKGEKWRSGKRSWSSWLSRGSKDERIQIGPSTVIWCSSQPDSTNEADHVPKKRPVRRVFVRVHPAAFLEVWTELLRVSKMQRPSVRLEDLRFEIGSIDITGPGATETLLGILHPYEDSASSQNSHEKTFHSLAGVTNASSLPSNSILAFSIMDPRLRYPPRPVKLPKANDEEANFSLLEMLSTWPVDASIPSPALFDRDTRWKATRLPAQKSINRRKALEKPGVYPSLKSTDPAIPIMLLASRSTASTSQQGTWTLLAPWKCILPIWYGLVHYPLSSGGNPRFGGINELRQTHFEHGVPMFPADYPGMDAGFAWEAEERERRKAEWERRPKGKRIEWTSLDLGAGRKGEIGRGWACDFERIIGIDPMPNAIITTETTQETQETLPPEPEKMKLESPIQHLPCKAFTTLLASSKSDMPLISFIATVRITLVTKGIASPCARVYRLPLAATNADQPDSIATSTSSHATRAEWLSILPPQTGSKPLPNPKKNKFQTTKVSLNAPISQRQRLLAQSLLQNPPLPYPAPAKVEDHPLVPDEEDLIGFVTTGEFNLAEGKGVAIGSVVVSKVLEGLRRPKEGKGKEGRLCIVRNAGEVVGRLARWEAV
ncbi:ribonucleases P/MRP protein subunit POP1-domain-containing protein [Halenospora varia]|nr:ribonucleases P/MRP protein subunit POP1-domain-containing protein [Halenospora varia]